MRLQTSQPFSALVVLLFAIGIDVVNALSSPPRAVRSLEHPQTRSLEILPRVPHYKPFSPPSKRSTDPQSSTLRYDDTFRLTLTAYDDVFHLHLRPNDDLIHPAARIVHYKTGADGISRESYTEPLLRESVKAFMGHVISPEYTDARLREDAARVTYSAIPEAEMGWARIMVHDQGDPLLGIPPTFEGAFTADGVLHHIMTKANYLRNKLPHDPEITVQLADPDSNLVIWRDSDVMSEEEEQLARTGQYNPESPHTKSASCAHDSLDFNMRPAMRPPTPMISHAIPVNSSLSRRDDVAGGDMGSNFVDHIGSTEGCPSDQRVVYMGVAADCEYVQAYGDKENATQQILNTWNSASSLYKSTFNISLGIVELQIQDSECPSTANDTMQWNLACSDSITLNNRLSDFSKWRGTHSDNAGLWHLMSGCPTGSEVGVAWLGVLCQKDTTQSSGDSVSGTGVSTNGRTEWQVVAHEIGHNFGAIHDCSDGCSLSDSCCPFSSSSCDAKSQFIMNPVSDSSEQKFSPCSIGNICSMFGGIDGSVDTGCLVSASEAQTTISLQMCGNGIVEDGEDCDPGSGVSSNCCDSSTCKFTNNAVCDPASSSCCTDTCGYAPSTQICRSAKDARCDTAESCTGSSASCPTDKRSDDGTSCGSNGLACASGQCTSVSQQCKSVGSSMNLTSACTRNAGDTCQVNCEDPTKSNQCVVLSSNLIDGSPCGYGGMCYSGKCKSGNVLNTAMSWYRQNLQIAIPVTVVVGLLVLAILFFILRSFYRCCTGGRNKTTMSSGDPAYTRLSRQSLPTGVYSQAMPTYLGGPNPPPGWQGAPVSQPNHVRGGSRGDWVNDTAYNGAGYRS